jgi:hypothetical protein
MSYISHVGHAEMEIIINAPARVIVETILFSFVVLVLYAMAVTQGTE